LAHNKCWDLVGGTAALTISKQMTHYAKVDVSGVYFCTKCQNVNFLILKIHFNGNRTKLVPYSSNSHIILMFKFKYKLCSSENACLMVSLFHL